MLTELSVGSGSASVALTFALLLKLPADCGLTRMFMTANAPFGRPPRLQVTVVVPVQGDPCVGVTETRLMPDGRLSVTTTLVAGDGPLFVTAIRYVRFASVTAGFGDAVFVSARLALAAPETIS